MPLAPEAPENSSIVVYDPDAAAAAPYPVPSVPDEFAAAPDIQEIIDRHIATYSRFDVLRSVRILPLWKREGGTSSGRMTLGKCVRPNSLLGHFTRVDFIIWLAADNVAISGLTPYQVDALVYHELLHIGFHKGKIVLVPHDLIAFTDEVRQFGLWKGDLTEAGHAFQSRLLLDDMDSAPEPASTWAAN